MTVRHSLPGSVSPARCGGFAGLRAICVTFQPWGIGVAGVASAREATPEPGALDQPGQREAG
jgi:hypothetical protein